VKTEEVKENTSNPPEKTVESTEEKKEPTEPIKPLETVFKEFDAKNAKAWGDIDLTSVLEKTNKKQKVLSAKPTTIIVTKKSE
jgi:hypothetical protein